MDLESGESESRELLDIEAAEEIGGRFIEESTRTTYISKYKNFYNWVAKFKPDFIQGGKVVLGRLTVKEFKEFFGYACRKRDDLGNHIEPNQYFAGSYKRNKKFDYT